MRSSDLLIVLGALGSAGPACGPRSVDATEVPAAPRGDGEAACRHELGRCGGHTPGDGACGGQADAATPSSPLVDVVVEPGKFAEIDLEMGHGATLAVAFTAAGGPLAWNVHSHAGEAVTTHAEGAGSDGEIRFTAPRAGLFSVLWQNDGAAATRLTTRLTPTGPVRVRSVHPAR
jgi:hypothetical protein